MCLSVRCKNNLCFKLTDKTHGLLSLTYQRIETVSIRITAKPKSVVIQHCFPALYIFCYCSIIRWIRCFLQQTANSLKFNSKHSYLVVNEPVNGLFLETEKDSPSLAKAMTSVSRSKPRMTPLSSLMSWHRILGNTPSPTPLPYQDPILFKSPSGVFR